MRGQNKRKIPSRDEIFRMDRGGVEPLEQDDNSAPETARTQPSYPQNYGINASIKRKAPLRELFGDRAISIKAELSSLLSLYSLQNVCQAFARIVLVTAIFLSVLVPFSHISAQTYSTSLPDGQAGSGQASTSTTLGTSTSTESLILELQSQIKALQTRINELEIELGVRPSAEVIDAPASLAEDGESRRGALIALPTFDRALSKGMSGDDIRNLQQFLAQFSDLYPEGLITGYYGPLTEKAVQRWQEKEGIVNSGTSDTTGYGRIGPKTRARLNDVAVKPPHKKVIICHIPSDNQENKQTLEIAESALKAHLAHGDYEGVCAIPPPPSIALSTDSKNSPQASQGQATTTPSTTATTTPSGTITATPAQPIGQTGTTTVPTTPAQPVIGTPPPSPIPSPTPSPTPSPISPPTATTTPPTTPPSAVDTTPPIISNVQPTEITSSSVTIVWNTNELSTSQVEHGLTSSYGSITAEAPPVFGHKMSIFGLQAGTTYHYRVISKDAAGNVVISGNYTFTSATVSSAASSTQTKLPAPTYIRGDWGYGWWDIRDNKMGQKIIFQYPSDSSAKATKFRLYQKRPADSSFSLAAEFFGFDSTSCTTNAAAIYNGEWYLKGSPWTSCPYWAISRDSVSASFYAVGEYNYYVVAVDAANNEGYFSQTVTFVFLRPVTITSPTASQITSMTPTFQWIRGSDWPSNFETLIVLFDSLTAINPSWTLSPWTVGISKIYDGPVLDLAKQYRVSVYGRSANPSQYIDSLALPTATIDFRVSTSTAVNRASSNLALILQSLSAALDDIQKQIQKLVR